MRGAGQGQRGIERCCALALKTRRGHEAGLLQRPEGDREQIPPEAPKEPAPPAPCFCQRNALWAPDLCGSKIMHRCCVKSLKFAVICHSRSRRPAQQPWEEGLIVGPFVQPHRGARTAPRSSSGWWWRWVHSQGVGGGQGLCLFLLRSPLPTQVSSSAPSSTPPACISVLSACRLPRTVVTKADRAAPRGLMGGAWVPLSPLEPRNNGLHVFCTHYSPGPVLRDSPPSINPKDTLVGALSSPFYRHREHTSSA